MLTLLDQMNDESLMVVFQDGGENSCAAYDILYRKYYFRLYAFLYSLTHDHHRAEDLAQDTFLRIIDRKHTFDHSRGGSFSSWLFTIATHLKHDDWRKNLKWYVQDTIDKFFNTVVDHQPEPLLELMIDDLSDFSERDRKILSLTIEGFTGVEIAEILQIPPGTVGRRRAQAINRLRAKAASVPSKAVKRTSK